MHDPSSADPAGYAAGLGHPDWPCLSADDSRWAQVPAVDFSPWVRARLADGDRDAILMLYRELDAAGSDDEDTGQAMPRPSGPVTATDWASATGRRVAAILDAPVDQALVGLGPDGQADLRVALLVGQFTGGGINGQAVADHDEGFFEGSQTPYLAGAMLPHDIRPADPEGLAAQANRHLLAASRLTRLPMARLEITADELDPPPLGPDDRPVRDTLAALPLNVRLQVAHWAFTAPRWQARVRPADQFRPWSPARQHGCDAGRAVAALCTAGILTEVDDPDRRRQATIHETTKATMVQALTDTGARFPRSANKPRLADALDDHAPGTLDRWADQLGPFLEFSDHGRQLLDWARTRVVATRWLWRAWQAVELTATLPRRYSGDGNDYDQVHEPIAQSRADRL